MTVPKPTPFHALLTEHQLINTVFARALYERTEGNEVPWGDLPPVTRGCIQTVFANLSVEAKRIAIFADGVAQ